MKRVGFGSLAREPLRKKVLFWRDMPLSSVRMISGSVMRLLKPRVSFQPLDVKSLACRPSVRLLHARDSLNDPSPRMPTAHLMLYLLLSVQIPF
ncbi:hypothetical protein AA0229_1924 [Gluconobacter cerinus NRIC 0229]|nr:hypothetical protein AA0229_1924 [Gluconobacter cerinus NRIC 0229]